MSETSNIIREPKYPRLAMLKGRFQYWLIQLRRKFPYLVWYGDELDVQVTFPSEKLPSGMEMRTEEDAKAVMAQLWSGQVYELEKQIRDMGIRFDTGIGPDGRDWEWDWSLSGPISVKFRRRARNPELRMERPRPKLVVANGDAA